MTAAAAGDARPVAVSGYMLRIGLPIANVDGTLITTGTGSGYVSTDDGTAGAIVPTFGAANSGNWVLDLTAAQMTGKKISGYITSNATGAIPTPFVIYPKSRVAIHTGTARTTGSPTTSQIQLATTASDKDSAYNNCLVGITGGTGPGALRRITSYVGATRMATLDAAWGTAPSTDSTYEILPTMEAVDVVAWKGLDIVQDAIPNVAANAAGGLVVLASVSGVLVAPSNALKWDSGALPTAFAANNLPSDYALQSTLEAVQTSISDLIPPEGIYAQSVTITSDGSTPVPNALVQIWSGDTLISTRTTGALGTASPQAGAGSYTLKVRTEGYNDYSAALTVAGNATVPTITLSAISVTPSATGFVTGYWTCYTAGVATAGVTHYLQHCVGGGVDGVTVENTVRSTTSSVTGLVQFAGIQWGSQVRVRRGAQGEWQGPFVAPSSGTTWALDEILGSP